MATTIIHGSNQDDILNGTPTTSNEIEGGKGDDIITGGFLADDLFGNDGNDVLYGEMGDSARNTFIPSGFVFTTPASLVVFGNDTMDGGNGDDIISGDQGVSLSIINFATSNALTSNTFISDFTLKGLTQIWGNDLIYGGNGNDKIYGDSVMTSIIGKTNGGTAIADGPLSHAVSNLTVRDSYFHFGHDTIDGGNGNDVIEGDGSTISEEPGGGYATATNGALAKASLYHFNEVVVSEGNTILGGNGDDAIYGNGIIHSHEIAGGNATADMGGTAITVMSVTATSLEFGGDILKGDNGNDKIYGDLETYYNAISGGTATADHGGIASSTVEIIGTHILFGNDQIDGGNGNDLLIGDAQFSTLEIEDPGIAHASNGGVATVTVHLQDFTLQCGNDLMVGGNGNDVLINDILDFELLNDVLTSNSVVINGVDHVKAADANGNNIIWGNDMLSGGNGQDTFVWTLFETPDHGMGTQGYDIVTDANINQDIFVFGNVADQNGDHVVNLHDLMETTTIFHDNGNSTITFEGGGAITLLHVNINSLSELHTQITSTPLVV